MTGQTRVYWVLHKKYFINKLLLQVILFNLTETSKSQMAGRKEKNAGHDMAIVWEPFNIDTHANILALIMIELCPQLCVHMY